MSTIRIELEIEGDEDDALQVVDSLLDAGVLQDSINEHDRDAGPLRVTSAVCSAVEKDPLEPQRAGRDARGIPMTGWPRLRDYDVESIADMLGVCIIAVRADGDVVVFKQHVHDLGGGEFELCENGGELNLFRVDRRLLGSSIPITCDGRPVGPTTLAYRIRMTLRGEPIDYAIDLDREKARA